MENFKLFLLEEKENIENTNLKKNVIRDLLDAELTSKDLYEHCKEIINYGCQSGCVPSLIYYSDTEHFFKDNSVDIINMLSEYQSENGIVYFHIDTNNLAWFGYESVVNDLLRKYEAEEEEKED